MFTFFTIMVFRSQRSHEDSFDLRLKETSSKTKPKLWDLIISFTFLLHVVLNFFPRWQVTCEYCFQHGACVPLRVHTVVVSIQHSEKITLEELRSEIMNKVIKEVIPTKYLDDKTMFHINPCGQFVLGGPRVSFFLASVLGPSYYFFSPCKYPRIIFKSYFTLKETSN